MISGVLYPSALILPLFFYLMISCEGELRNGTKNTKLAYLLPISGNSGVQKHMAFGEEKPVAPLIAIPNVDKAN